MAEGEEARDDEVAAGLGGDKGEGGASGADGCFDNQSGPTRKAGDESDGDGKGVFGGSIGKGLGGDDNSDPQKNAEGDFEGDEAEYESSGA